MRQEAASVNRKAHLWIFSVRVLDEQMQLAPVGVAGELSLGGAGVGRGYWGRAELTAERFVPDGVVERESRSAAVSDGRPGEMGMKPGRLEYVGRKDEQVKVRGYRIELGEIEAVLGEPPGSGAGCGGGARGSPGESGRRLVGYVVRRGEERSAGSGGCERWLEQTAAGVHGAGGVSGVGEDCR